MPITVNDLYPITPDDIKKVREYYLKTEDDIKEMVVHLRDWLGKQPHLPKSHEDERLERFLLRNKFRLEHTKQKLENYYTLRGRHHDMFDVIDPETELMQNYFKSALWVPLPKLTPKLERIIIFRVQKGDFVNFYKFKYAMVHILLLLDIQLSHDYATADRIVLDMGWSTLGHLKSVEPSVLVKSMKLHQDAFCGRLSAIDFINSPPWINLLLTLIKSAVSGKLFSKIKIHNNLESLQKDIPVEYLPEDYGGSIKSCNLLHEEICKLMVQEKEFLFKHAARISDETKRIGKVNEDENFGMEGSFRKLNLD